MIEKYLVDGKPFSVHSSQKEAFLKKYPNAVLQKEPVEKKPVETTEEVSLQVDSETLEQSKKFTKKIYKDYNVQDFNDFPKEIKNQFLTEQFEANELDVEESFNMLKRQKEIEDKEAQLSKFFQETKRVQSETGNLPAYDVGGQFDSEYKPTKEELENPLYQDFFNPDASTVYHLASVVGVRKYIDDPLGVIDTIVLGSRNIIDLCVKHKTRILFASTSEIYGKNPNFPWKEDGDRVLGDPSVDRWSYSTSKALVEHMLFPLYRANKLDFSTVRFFNVYGPRQNPIYVVSQTIYRILRNEKPDVYDGGIQTRCFTYIDDIIEGLLLAGTRKEALGNVFNLGSQQPTNMRTIIDLCINISKKNS